jgi:tRNA pseudouridine38-40 synthase
MRTLKLTIAYDGTAYAGWQVQPDQPTVQETLEKAIAKVTGQSVRVLASGRTDAGVHAAGQVVGFRTESAIPPAAILRALNANLPEDVAVLEVAEAPADFHAISHVRRKRYRYVIHDGPVRDVFRRHFVWHYIHGRLDAGAMQRAAAALLGTHDFSSFETAGAPRADSIRTVFDLSVQRGRAGDCPNFRSTKMGLSPFDEPDRGRAGQGEEGRREKGEGREEAGCVERTVDAGWDSGDAGAFHAPYGSGPHAEREEYIVVEIEADGFLYNMVRAIVGTLVEVGRGARPESWPGEVLRAVNRRVAGPTAPPQGLFLVSVEYEPGEEKGKGRSQ